MIKLTFYLVLFLVTFSLFFVPVAIHAQTTFWNLERDTGVTTPNALNMYLTLSGAPQPKVMTILQNGTTTLGSSTAGGLRVSSADALGVILAPSQGNGNIRITDDSTQAIRGITIANGGLLGIGTAAPATKLDVDGSITQSATHGNNMKLWLSAARNGGGTGEVGLYSWISEPGVSWTGGGIARNMYNTTGFPRINTGLSGQMMHFTEAGNVEFTTETAAGVRSTPLAITNAGNVGIGTAAPAGKLDVQILANKHIGFVNWNNVPTLAAFNDGLTTWDNLVIAPVGNVGIGTASPGTNKLYVNGPVRIENGLGLNGYNPGACNGLPTAGLVHGLCLGGSGYSQTGWYSGSDIRYKKNIKPIENALTKILSLEGVTFQYNKDTELGKNYPDSIQMGFIAQQVEPIVPEVVSTNGDGYKAMIYANLTALLTEGVKEQQAQITELKNYATYQSTEIDLLKGQIELLKKEIEELQTQ